MMLMMRRRRRGITMMRMRMVRMVIVIAHTMHCNSNIDEARNTRLPFKYETRQ